MSTLVVTDLDGTLWDTSERCHPKTLAAIDELYRRGIPLLAATGRRERGARLGYGFNDLSLPTVLVNGGTAFDFASGKQLFVDSFDSEFLLRLLGQLDDVGLSPAILTSPDGVVAGPKPTLDNRYLEALGSGLQVESDLVAYVAGASRLFIGLVLMAMDATELARARTVFDEIGHTSYSFHLDHYYPGWMIMAQPEGVSKWSGIQRYVGLALEGVERVVVLGDSTNDIPMFKGADLAVWVEGGNEQVRKFSDLTIPSPTVGGWADIVDIVSD